jgi:hypothetical protein
MGEAKRSKKLREKNLIVAAYFALCTSPLSEWCSIAPLILVADYTLLELHCRHRSSIIPELAYKLGSTD